VADDKASKTVVDTLLTRVNKLDEKVKFEMGIGDKASLTGSSAGDDDDDDDDDDVQEDSAEQKKKDKL